MTSRLRSILGTSNRVRKKTSTSTKTTARSGGSNNNNSNRDSPSSSSWSDSLPRTKTGISSSNKSSKTTKKSRKTAEEEEEDDDDDEVGEEYEEDYFHDSPLQDDGLVYALATDLTLRDVPQAMRYARNHMFTPVPDPPSRLGLRSTRVAEVLTLRRNLPPVGTAAHLHGLLLRMGPTAVEREMAELVTAGTLRKMVIWRRGGGGNGSGGGSGSRSKGFPDRGLGRIVELLIEGQDLEALVQASGQLDEETKGDFVEWLRGNPTKLKVSSTVDIDRGEGGGGQGGGGGGGKRLKPEQVDQLVKGGFLTTYHDFDIGHVSSGFARPEDRGTMLSLESVSRAAAGSVAAVGGQGAIHSSGGSGGARSGGVQSRRPGGGGDGADLSLAVPGQGAYLKLLSAALSHLGTILCRSTYREMPETAVRERWDGGVANARSRQHAGKLGRREFAGVLPGRTRKWKEFYGLGFDWVLHEAVGTGLVEVFETGSVGRGVRLL